MNGDVVWETEKRAQLLIPTNDGNIEREAYLLVTILPDSNGMEGFLRIANPGDNLTIDFSSCGYPYVPTTGLIVNYPLPLPSGRICTDDEGDADFQYPSPQTVDAWAIARDRVLWWVRSKSDVELGALLLDIVFEDSKAFRGQMIAMVKDVYGAGLRLQRMNLDATTDRRGSLLGILTRSVLSSMRSLF
jgi:hypothetical protein